MARQPADVIARKRKPQGRDGIWVQIRNRRRFTAPEINRATDIPIKTITDYLKCLEAGGYLTSAKPGRAARVYKLIKDTGVETPRVQRDGAPVTQGLGNEQMWRTMKSLKQFTWRDLAIHASTDAQPVTEEQAKSYCGWLHKAGYLVALQIGSSNVPTTYRFARDTGPKPPQIQRVKQVFDANERQVVWSREMGARS